MENIFKFSYNNVSIVGHSEIDYKIGDKEFSFIPDYNGKFVANDDNVKVTAHVIDDKDKKSIYLDIENISGKEIYLSQVYPLVADGKDIKIGSTEHKDLIVYSQGRHKNDLPSVCRLGSRDVCWTDMLASLTEGGAMIPQEVKEGITTVTGDSLSVIHGKDASLTIGYMTTRSQLCESSLDVDDNGNIVKFALGCIFNCVMPNKVKRTTETIRLDSNLDSLAAIDDFANTKATMYNARVINQKVEGLEKPSVWCSWYYYGGFIFPKDITENLEKIKEFNLPYNVMQIDDGWQICDGDWEPKPHFAEVGGMKAIAEEISNYGLVPGIWTAPFIASPTTSLINTHPNWLLKTKDGEYAKFAKIFYILDVTHPEVLAWYKELFNRISNEWGFKYHKMDFTRSFIQVKDPDPYDPTVTPVEAYTKAIEVIREGMGEDAYFLMCGGLYDPLIGIVDGQRTGSDVTSMWIEPGCKYPTLPYTVKQNTLRYYMNKWWNNDPDSLMVRRRDKGGDLQLGLLTDDEAKTFTVNQYFGGGIFCSTEKLAEIDKDRLNYVSHCMPVVNTEPVPRKLFDCERFQSQIDVKVTAAWGDTWHTIVIVNWDDTPKKISLKLDEKLCGKYINKHNKYNVSTFYTKELMANCSYGDTVEFGELAPHSSEIVRVGVAGEPQIVFSNTHYSFGGELIDLIVNENGIDAVSRDMYDFDAEYSVLMPDGEIVNLY